MFDYILYKDINSKYFTFGDLVPEEEKATDEDGNKVEAEVVEANILIKTGVAEEFKEPVKKTTTKAKPKTEQE